jgi:hypothetical protein
MFRAARVLILAVVVAVSLLGSASIASADGGRTKPLPPPAHVLDISWE